MTDVICVLCDTPIRETMVYQWDEDVWCVEHGAEAIDTVVIIRAVRNVMRTLEEKKRFPACSQGNKANTDTNTNTRPYTLN